MRIKKDLSPREKEILQYLRIHFLTEKKPYSPSIRDIAYRLKMSTSHTSFCLDALQDSGYVEREPKLARTIRLTEYGKETHQNEENQA